MDIQQSRTRIKTRIYKCKICLKDNLLIIFVLLGAIIGFGAGFGVRPLESSSDEIMWLGLPGDMFMRMLKMTILPLIVASIISSTAELDPRANGKMGMMAVSFVLIGNFTGAILAAMLFYIFTPGKSDNMADQLTADNQKLLQTQDLFADFIRNLVPDNVVTACFQKTQTSYVPKETTIDGNITTIFIRTVGAANGSNVLGLIIVCSLIGMASARADEVGKPFLVFFQAASDIIIILLKWLIWFTPIGVASLIAKSIAQIKDIETTFKNLGLFIATFTIGMVIHAFVMVPVLWLIVMRTNPFRLLLNSFRPLITVFAPPSSAVGIPEIINLCENKYDVDPRVSRFAVVFGATMSRMGSCYFICLSALFIANLEGVHLPSTQILLIIILSALGSLALPAVPSSSIVIVIIVLASLDVTATNVGILLALEWYSDRIRSCNNSLNNIIGTLFIYKFCKKGLAHLDREKSETAKLTAQKNYDYDSVSQSDAEL